VFQCITKYKEEWGVIASIFWDHPTSPTNLEPVFCTSDVTIQTPVGIFHDTTNWSHPSKKCNKNITQTIIKEFKEDDVFNMNVPSYASVNERFQIYQVARKLAAESPGSILFLDVGVGTGRLSHLVRNACQRDGTAAEGIGVDPYPSPIIKPIIDKWEQYHCIKTYLHKGIKDVIDILEKRQQGVDLILIDADYSQAGVHNAYQLLSPIVKPGGRMVWAHYYDDNRVSKAQVKARYDDIRVPHVPCETAQTLGQEVEFHTHFTKTEWPVLYPEDASPPQGWMKYIASLNSTLGIFKHH